MPQLGGAPCLALKSLQIVRRRQQTGVRNLERDNAVELRVSGAPDGAEATFAHVVHQLKAAKNTDFSKRTRCAHWLDTARTAACRAQDGAPIFVRPGKRIVAVRTT